MNYGFVITSAGWRLLSKLVGAKCALEISKIMVGKGRVPEKVNPADLTDLLSPIAPATSTKPLIKENTVSFVVEYRSDLNGGLEEGFWLNEFGIFAKDPDEGDILLYYATLGDYPQYVTAFGTGAVDIRRFPVSITLTSEMEIVVDYPQIAFMTSDEIDNYAIAIILPKFVLEAQNVVNQHDANRDAHQDLRNDSSSLEARIGRLEDMLLNDITGNPFMVDFKSLDGLVVQGVWNRTQQRIEF